MSQYLRRSAWNNGGTFDNSDLFWYAKGVGEMMKKSLDDPDSWWFFAAIHGEYVNDTQYPGWGFLPSPPQVPTEPQPKESVSKVYWNQCQHQSWYFPPWHRGYCLALEGQIRKHIIAMGGPEDWALPYWNYLGGDGQNYIPPAFTEEKLSDGSPNPLYVDCRYGPFNDGNIYVRLSIVNGDCQNDDLYTGSNAVTKAPGYGGPETGFSHDGDVNGNLESNPHNKVHVEVGGHDGSIGGLMGDPGLAALDPIFYLHHCNIDRMWAAWNNAGNTNPTDANWLAGPAAIGEREFIMPMADGSSWVYTPKDVNDTYSLGYTYEDLQLDRISTNESMIAARLTKLGVQSPSLLNSMNMSTGGNSELIGSNDRSVKIGNDGSQTSVQLERRSVAAARKSLNEAAADNLPDHIYLHLENVTGNMDANLLEVYVNGVAVGHVSLFGVRRASRIDDHKAGTGLTFILDITSVFDDLHLQDSLDNSLNVELKPDNRIPDHLNISVGKVNIYRQQHG